jgi:acylphosphatase
MNTGSLPSIESRLLRVEGRVQGVGYRDFCVRRARSLGLAGWVRNRLDGSVEVLLQGPAEALDRMDADLRAGPPASRVDRVRPGGEPADAAPLQGFEARPTA